MNRTRTIQALGAWFALVLASALLLTGCAKKSSAPQLTAKDHAESGWSDFQSENYGLALSDFEQAISKDDSYFDAFLGAGWANLYSGDASTARMRFNSGRELVESSEGLPDFDAALALACFENELYELALAAADSCLERTPDYSFIRKSSVNYIDLLVAKANAHFQLGGDSNLAKAAAVVHQVSPGINLDPANSSSWRVDGVRYDTFSEALIRGLERAAEIAASS